MGPLSFAGPSQKISDVLTSGWLKVDPSFDAGRGPAVNPFPGNQSDQGVTSRGVTPFLFRSPILGAPVCESIDLVESAQPRRRAEGAVRGCDGGESGFDFYDVSADGQKFLMNLPTNQGTMPLTLFSNWTAALKK